MKISTKNNRINDIARQAGVSPSTVSRVFNNRPYVKEEIRERVLKTAVTMDYAPKAIARRDTISVIVSGIDAMLANDYERNLVNRLFAVANEHGICLDFMTLKNIERVYQNFSRAVIAMIYSERQADILRSIRNIPVLTINYITEGCSYVCTDHYQGIYQAANYLIEKGHRKIAILFAPYEENMSWGEAARRDGYRQALREHGIPFRRELEVYGTRVVLDRPAKMLVTEQPSALIVCGESLTMPVKYTLDLFHKKVPEDLSLITFYSPEISPYLIPEPACIHQDFDQLAATVIEKADALMRGEIQRAEVLLENRFTEGSSVRELK